MADTAHKTDAELVEHFDEPAVLEAKLDTLAEWVAASRHMVSFTGAGISTSAGIPDFRGPDGVWTMKAQGRKPVGRDYSKGFAPTAGHMVSPWLGLSMKESFFKEPARTRLAGSASRVVTLLS